MARTTSHGERLIQIGAYLQPGAISILTRATASEFTDCVIALTDQNRWKRNFSTPKAKPSALHCWNASCFPVCEVRKSVRMPLTRPVSLWQLMPVTAIARLRAWPALPASHGST